MKTHIASFYRYCTIDDPESLRATLQDFCTSHKILGRILLGSEGINGSVSGSEDAINTFKKYIQNSFASLTFREQIHAGPANHKLVVRTRKEIVAFGKPINIQQAAGHISPEVLHEKITTKKDVVLLDVRNIYETAVGKFRNAITFPLENFRDFPNLLPVLLPYKNREIVMYCTGGVRCEKASAYLKEQGFPHVQQLEGGIINYLNAYPNGHFEGNCFVFDDRLTSHTNTPISQCIHCKAASDSYVNCHNLDCDKLHIACPSCQQAMARACSKQCKQAQRQRPKL